MCPLPVCKSSVLAILYALSLTTGAADFRQTVEQDWLLQEQFTGAPAPETEPMTTQLDAAGGCDGIKDGTYGFHTGSSPSPWWQVDLGAVYPIARILVWNRCDGAQGRAYTLSLRLSNDSTQWTQVYRHKGTPFSGFPDQKPLCIRPQHVKARYVRITVPGQPYLHLDEVEVFGADDPAVNLALHAPANQISVSTWSKGPKAASGPIDFAPATRKKLAHALRVCKELHAQGVDTANEKQALKALSLRMAGLPDKEITQQHYFQVRWILRQLSLANPLLDAQSILFTKRVPGSFNHMSDQYIGWWSRPGGGIYILNDYRQDTPSVRCISQSFPASGSFLRPMLSYDARKVIFAWCRHYPGLAAEQNKLDKANVPEDAFYHIFEMNVDGTGVRQLTQGKYDDFDARYLPDGRIVFCSTRRGQFIQCGLASAQRTMTSNALPDVYVRCGGGPERPCVVYTLHTMEADGSKLCAISPFEMFEWTPTVAHDGSILYSRWDYIDRHNMPYMSLWAMHPDGTNARSVYANYTRTPHCTFEPRSIPNSNKLVFTASAHHSQTKGSLVLLNPSAGDEGAGPITRLTPEVPFPEAEAWPLSYYANPWPLSERFYLVAWGAEGLLSPARGLGWDRWHAVDRPANGMGLYFFDAAGNMELIYRDTEISCLYPMPLKSRPRPAQIASPVDWQGKQEGRFLLSDVYRGLKTVKRGAVKALRVVAVPAKTHPTMNYPSLGVTRDDPGKCVLGTVPVEADGSAYFRVPSGVICFFQALDAQGMAIQTMRSTTHVQPGQTLGCVGCHESRKQAPASQRVLAAQRPPSRLTLGPEGSWPLRFDRLVQPVLDRHCVECHNQDALDAKAKLVDLSAAKAYDALVRYGTPSLHDHVLARYSAGRSVEGACAAQQSKLLQLLTVEGHYDIKLSRDEQERLIVWMDTYAQRLGSFDEGQEQQLEELKQRSGALLSLRIDGAKGL
jgi:hypothetical protein